MCYIKTPQRHRLVKPPFFVRVFINVESLKYGTEKFEVLTAALLKIQGFYVTPCRQINIYRRFERLQHFQIHGKAFQNSTLLLLLDPKKEGVVRFLET
jgi:hypothetical protein